MTREVSLSSAFRWEKSVVVRDALLSPGSDWQRVKVSRAQVSPVQVTSFSKRFVKLPGVLHVLHFPACARVACTSYRTLPCPSAVPASKFSTSPADDTTLSAAQYPELHCIDHDRQSPSETAKTTDGLSQPWAANSIVSATTTSP